MTDPERASLRGYAGYADSFGIFRPLRPGLNVLSLDESTAAFHDKVSVRGGYRLSRDAEVDSAAVERLVMDRVLQVKADGCWVTGLAAYSWLHPPGGPVPGDSSDWILAAQTASSTTLSTDAVRYGQALHLNDSGALSSRLYGYNRLPISQSWRARLAAEDSVPEFLDVRAGSHNRRLLDQNWIENTDAHWLHWRAKVPTGPGPRPHKLYVSPRPDQLPDALKIAIRLFTDMRVPAFKVARTLRGILRPDKVVAYFSDDSQLMSAAAELDRALVGIPAHGVPFTAAADSTGLLSSGVDPPPEFNLRKDQPISWRRWLTDRLAAALVVAGIGSGPDSVLEREPWEFALERLRLAGVHVSTWRPVTDWYADTNGGQV